jgi:class 3 adenylate cyclase
MPLDPELEAVIDRHFQAPTVEQIFDVRVPGVTPDSLTPMIQAYMRGLGRIVAAESDHVRRLLKRAPPERRPALLDTFLSRNLPTAHHNFQQLHTVMLRDATRDALETIDEPDQPDRVIALVDICDSTGFLGTADREQTRKMVDALYEASQSAVTDRPVWAVKYVGDGVFLVGRDVSAVVAAAREAIAVLERELPLRARAGIALGPVVRRAGDYFGPVVNLAQRLTTAARPGTILAAEPALSRLPAPSVCDRRLIEVRGVDEPIAVGVVEG